MTSSVGLSLPQDHVELPFLEYWAENLLDPRDPDNPRWLEYELKQLERGRKYAKRVADSWPLADKSLLDVGCQTGAMSIALAEFGARVSGVDVNETLIHAARIRSKCYDKNIDFKVGVAEELPYADASFDFVVFVDVIEHVADHARSLASCVRVLKPGGKLYLMGPNRLSPKYFWRDPHYRMFGISVLPQALGDYYVTKVRGRPAYDVGVFPIGSSIVDSLEKLGMRIEAGPHLQAGFLGRLGGRLKLDFSTLFTLLAEKI
jgi:SAM-dependent methyltransferase